MKRQRPDGTYEDLGPRKVRDLRPSSRRATGLGDVVERPGIPDTRAQERARRLKRERKS